MKSRIIPHAFFLGAVAAVALLAPAHTVSTTLRLLILVGFVGLWRYSWLLLNTARAVLYDSFAYPRMRARAERDYAANPFRPHAYFLLTSYRIEQRVTRAVIRSVFAAAARSEAGGTIVASVVEESDEKLIREIHSKRPSGGADVRLEVVRIPGTGKRDALAHGLRLIASLNPSPNDIVLLVDGDSCVPLDITDRSAPFLLNDPRVGALTTDEISRTQGSQLFQDWYALKFAQRQMMMCSMGLSRRVLTLTGRMSIFRASVAVDPGFIECVQHDSVSHWRLGEVKFLTGDDKSTWFWLLREGYHMLYLPDVKTVSFESQPHPEFIRSARVLMTRWYGNTMRNNARALALGPGRIGFFTWVAVLDQRLSMWTTLAGPISALLGALFVDPLILLLYVPWVLATRYVACAGLMMFRFQFPLSYPFLLYFGQVYGALIKAYVFFNPDRQRWTRQNTVQGTATGWRGSVMALSSTYMHALALGALVTLVAVMTGFINLGFAKL